MSERQNTHFHPCGSRMCHGRAMPERTIQELIDQAEAVLRPRQVDDRWFADVAAAIETDAGSLYLGVCIDTGGTGYCAEQAAAAAMLTAGESRVRRVVAVWRDSRAGDDSPLYVLPPCGVCRLFLIDVDPANSACDVVIGASQTVPLTELLPLGGWATQPARSDAAGNT